MAIFIFLSLAYFITWTFFTLTSEKGRVPFQVRMQETSLHEDGTGIIVKEIQAKGLIPISRFTKIGFLVSVLDHTGKEIEPILCSIEDFQEDDSIVFMSKVLVGGISQNQGFKDWIRIGVIIPEILYPPHGGYRSLRAVIRMIDLNNPPLIKYGYSLNGERGVIWRKEIDFTWNFPQKGYLEASEHRDEAIGLSLKIGMAVAMADGSLDDKEGHVLKRWVEKSISSFHDKKQKKLKQLYNDAMKESYEMAKKGILRLSTLTSRLNEIGDKAVKYEALELCFEVMAADGVADDNEISVIKNIADALELDMNEVSKIRDKKIIHLSSDTSEHANVEAMLGIDSNWSNEKIRQHLRREFQKWNNRLNTLDEGNERENAQRMLDKIADARKKYEN